MKKKSNNFTESKERKQIHQKDNTIMIKEIRKMLEIKRTIAVFNKESHKRMFINQV